MKIKPIKQYDKPYYAVKVAAMLTAAGMITGCTNTGNSEIALDGETVCPPVTEQTEITVGEVTIPETMTTENVIMPGAVVTDTEPLQLDGDVIATEPLQLDGDVVCPVE